MQIKCLRFIDLLIDNIFYSKFTIEIKIKVVV